jgi:hypothetical protein
MLFREKNSVYFEKHINSCCGQNAGSFNVEAGGSWSDHCALNGQII